MLIQYYASPWFLKGVTVIPAICLSGKGGIGINENFSSSLSCNQSKCLYLLLTAMLLY